MVQVFPTGGKRSTFTTFDTIKERDQNLAKYSDRNLRLFHVQTKQLLLLLHGCVAVPLAISKQRIILIKEKA